MASWNTLEYSRVLHLAMFISSSLDQGPCLGWSTVNSRLSAGGSSVFRLIRSCQIGLNLEKIEGRKLLLFWVAYLVKPIYSEILEYSIGWDCQLSYSYSRFLLTTFECNIAY